MHVAAITEPDHHVNAGCDVATTEGAYTSATTSGRFTGSDTAGAYGPVQPGPVRTAAMSS